MSPRLIALLLVAAPQLAAANGTAPPPVEPAPPVESVTDPRDGFHYGGSVGAAYVPIDGGISAFILRADLNWGSRKGERRLSPILYMSSAASGVSTVGLGVIWEQRWHFGDTVTVGLGVMGGFQQMSEEGVDTAVTPAIGVTATPIALRLGAKRRIELAFNAFVIREFDRDSVNPGGWLSIGFLAL